MNVSDFPLKKIRSRQFVRNYAVKAAGFDIFLWYFPPMIVFKEQAVNFK